MRFDVRLVVGSCAFALALAGCSSSSSSPPAPTSTANAVYPTFATITVPNVSATSATFSFDIGWVDPVAKQYYLADRTNNGVSVFNTTTQTYVSTAGQGAFTGLGIGSPPAANTGGPNGVLSIGGGILFAGDGNSTTKVLNATTGAVLANIPMVNPVVTAQPQLAGTQCNKTGTPTVGAGNLRADELAYDPVDNEVLMINDASCPAFGTFISTIAPYPVLGTVVFPTATAGAEQPTWDPGQSKFLMALPATIANPGGELDLIDPKTFAITAKFGEPNGCQANGTALGPSEQVFLGCSNVTGPLVIMNATNGATVATFGGIGGCDEVWYNPTAKRFYGACSNNTFGPLVAVIDATTNKMVTTLPATTGAHSVAVDPAVDRIYVPQRATPNFGITTFGP